MPNWQTNGNAAGAGDILGTTNNQPLIIHTNDAERLRVLADGKVGLGLDNPSTELHVAGRHNERRRQQCRRDRFAAFARRLRCIPR